LNEILISGGARPIIYTIYETIIDPGETVVFAAPSWNNLHYSHLMRAKSIYVDTFAEDDFMPTAANLAPHLPKANLLALCSPLNPTGTVFSKQALSDICDLVVTENERRKTAGEKPLYVLYDQIYCVLTFGDTQHYNPVSLRPELRDYTIFVDGASKCFAATGIRVGWAFGPAEIIDRMKAILSHIGAWAPKAEQLAVARFMDNEKACNQFITDFKAELLFRLDGLHNGLQALKAQGYAVDSIAPQAAIYLSVKFDLKGKLTANGNILATQEAVTNYLIDEAGMALVPFPIFGTGDSPWYRLSVGTCKREEVQLALDKLALALQKLS
jgi:aspartate aminotransferase